MGSSERYDESETDDGCYESDDSQEDPTFEVLEETFSNLSLKRKTKIGRIVKPMDEREDEESDSIEIVLPELNAKEQKSYEAVLKIIEVGQVERLKVDECKIYLRKHGLRLSGNKEILIQRIKEHVDISNGGGEKKYPALSFVLNCKGDACMGDIVMFEQNVYEMFNIASRSANGPPCGKRIVAGRIVKESYGAAKQQHTFTIEVLWSKGEKPLPPLHPMLIKGRNLYRLKTLRQKWKDEGERQKILSEKHARGGVARLNREARIQQKEMRKMHKPTRPKGDEHLERNQEDGRREPLQHCVSVKPQKLINQSKQQQQQVESKINIPIHKPNSMSNAHVLQEYLHQKQPLINVNSSSRGVQQTSLLQSSTFDSSKNSTQVSFQEVQHFKENQNDPLHGFHRNNNKQGWQSNMNFDRSRYSQHSYGYYRQNLNAAGNPPFQDQGCREKQKCRYYAQGRCHFGDRCKYLHEIGGNNF